MESGELQQGQIVTRDRVAVEVSRELFELKEWLKGLWETGSQLKLT